MPNPKRRSISRRSNINPLSETVLSESLYRWKLDNLGRAETATPIVTKGNLDQKWEVHPLFTEVVRECKKCKAEAVQIRTDGKAVKAICLHCFNIQEV